MKKYFLTTLLALIVIPQAFSQGQVLEARIVELAKKKFQWMIGLQYDSLDRILDDRLIYIHSNGLTQTRQEFIADSKSGKIVYQVIDVKEINARAYGDAVIVTGKGKFSGIANAAAFATELLFTEVYILKDKRWQLASRHANKLL